MGAAGLLMLGMVAWVLLSAAVAGMVMLVTIIHEETERLRDWSDWSDESDDWLV